MRNIDIENYSIGNIGRNYAGVPHCELCGWKPKPNSNYGLMLGAVRLHKQKEHGQKRMKHLSKRPSPGHEPDISLQW